MNTGGFWLGITENEGKGFGSFEICDNERFLGCFEIRDNVDIPRDYRLGDTAELAINLTH